MIELITTSLLLGVALAMDAFSVSVADAISEPDMKKNKALSIPLIFAIFQGAMPLIGWFCVKGLVGYLTFIEPYIPFISFGLLALIGINMIREGVKCDCEDGCCGKLSLSVLLLQGVATSIDALSVGLTLEKYDVWSAFGSAAIIAAVTYSICLSGIYIGKKIGDKLSNKAQIFGGVILCAMAIKFLMEGIL